MSTAGDALFLLAEEDWIQAPPGDRPSKEFLQWHNNAVFLR